MKKTDDALDDAPVADPIRRAERVADILAGRAMLVSILQNEAFVALSHERPLEFLGDWHDMTTVDVSAMTPRQIADKIYAVEVEAALAWRKRDANESVTCDVPTS